MRLGLSMKPETGLMIYYRPDLAPIPVCRGCYLALTCRQRVTNLRIAKG